MQKESRSVERNRYFRMASQALELADQKRNNFVNWFKSTGVWEKMGWLKRVAFNAFWLQDITDILLFMNDKGITWRAPPGNPVIAQEWIHNQLLHTTWRSQPHDVMRNGTHFESIYSTWKALDDEGKLKLERYLEFFSEFLYEASQKAANEKLESTEPACPPPPSTTGPSQEPLAS